VAKRKATRKQIAEAGMALFLAGVSEGIAYAKSLRAQQDLANKEQESLYKLKELNKLLAS
jgi:hypothetical protein